MADQILVRKGAVLDIQFNRPEKKNAVTREMYLSLYQALAAADQDDAVRAVLFHGSGGCFCAGNDIGDLAAGASGASGADADASGAGGDAPQKFMNQLASISKPMVAAVSGAAVGIGATMLLHCDFVYADDSALFLTPFTDLGLCPEAGSSFTLRDRIGYSRAAEMLLLGTPVDAERAASIGLINAVTPAEQLLQTARSTAERLASLSPASVQTTRRLMRHGLPQASHDAFDREIEAFRELLHSPEAQQAFATFLQGKKR